MCHEIYDLRARRREFERQAAIPPKPRIEREPAFALRPIFARLLKKLTKQPVPVQPLKEA